MDEDEDKDMTMRARWVFGWVIASLLSPAWADGLNSITLANTGLKHFTVIDKRVFAGSKPKTNADFDFLRSKGVKYILEAHFLPFMMGSERKKAAQFGMELMAVPMNASPVAPQQRRVDEILRIMRTRQPIYLHCVLGRDRTSLLAGLYRIYFEGMPRDEAYKQMKEEGFRDVFFLHGLKAYFEKHSRIPAELADLAH